VLVAASWWVAGVNLHAAHGIDRTVRPME